MQIHEIFTLLVPHKPQIQKKERTSLGQSCSFASSKKGFVTVTFILFGICGSKEAGNWDCWMAGRAGTKNWEIKRHQGEQDLIDGMIWTLIEQSTMCQRLNHLWVSGCPLLLIWYRQSKDDNSVTIFHHLLPRLLPPDGPHLVQGITLCLLIIWARIPLVSDTSSSSFSNSPLWGLNPSLFSRTSKTSRKSGQL